MRQDQLIALAALLLMLPLFGAGALWVLRIPRRLERNWSELASNYPGLRVGRDEPFPHWPHIVGTYRDLPVHLRLLNRVSGRIPIIVYGYPRSVVQLTLTCRRALPRGLSLYPPGARAVGAKASNIVLGVDVFDRSFIIDGADESGVRALLSDARVQEALLACAQSGPALAVVNDQVVVEKVDENIKPVELHSMLEAAARVAIALETFKARKTR
jgi:hypothetical protein